MGKDKSISKHIYIHINKINYHSQMKNKLDCDSMQYSILGTENETKEPKIVQRSNTRQRKQNSQKNDSSNTNSR